MRGHRPAQLQPLRYAPTPAGSLGLVVHVLCSLQGLIGRGQQRPGPLISASSWLVGSNSQTSYPYYLLPWQHLHNQIHFIPEQRTYLPELLIEIEGRTQSGCPPASKRPERTDCRARRGFCGQSEIIFSHEQLTVCIKHIREWYYASFVGLLGKILHPLKRINLSDNLISVRL